MGTRARKCFVSLLNIAEAMRVAEKIVGDAGSWEFPSALVSAVEIKLA
jgi:hypothetical protein